MSSSNITNPAIVAELTRLTAAHGGILQPAVLVEAARDEDSPLHSAFEWDDSEAAHRWRLHQARNLIKAVVTYEKTGDGKMVPCRVMVSLTPDREQEGGGYRLTANVMSNQELRAQLLADARAEMLGFRRKYQQLSELAAVFEAIDHVVVEHREELATA